MFLVGSNPTSSARPSSTSSILVGWACPIHSVMVAHRHFGSEYSWVLNCFENNRRVNSVAGSIPAASAIYGVYPTWSR